MSGRSPASLGTFDRAQLQRGFQVYKEVCAACHGLNFVSFRNLAQRGGPEFTAAQAAAIAADWMHKVREIGDDGQPDRACAAACRSHSRAFPEPEGGRGCQWRQGAPGPVADAEGALLRAWFPWFLFDIVTLYQEHGADYVKAFLTGYEDGHETPPGTHYNKYYPGNFVGMPTCCRTARSPTPTARPRRRSSTPPT